MANTLLDVISHIHIIKGRALFFFS